MLLGHFEKMNVKMPNAFLWTSLYTMTRMIDTDLCYLYTIRSLFEHLLAFYSNSDDKMESWS